MKKIKIGFIGIGLMGFPMAKNLLKSKYQVKAFNRTKNKALRLKKFGAEVCNSLKEVVSDRDLIITMLSDCLLYTSPSPRDLSTSRMPSSA